MRSLNQDNFTAGVYTLKRNDLTNLDETEISSISIINFSETECTFTPTFLNWPHPDNDPFVIRMPGSSFAGGNFPAYITKLTTNCTDFQVCLLKGPIK